MAYAAQIGLGGKLEIDTAYPGTPALAEIGHLVDVDFSIDGGEAETTHTQVGAGTTSSDPPFWKTWLPGSFGVELTFLVVFDPGDTEHDDVILDELGIVRAFKYTWPDGTTWQWEGFYRAVPISIPMEDRASASITCRLSGKPTITAHS